jgi:heat-inducible transcriptional repressor
MNERQGQILKHIVDEYVRTAEPVSSKLLCDRYPLNCSSATVRNDMAVLEEEGLITQPHTSAGRIPTEKAYREYIKNIKQEDRKTVKINITLQGIVRPPNFEERMKEIGIALARASGDAVMIATNRPWSATIGLGNLLRKPDFRSEEAILRLAESLEQFDAALKNVLEKVEEDIQVVLGEENPFGSNLASVVVRHRLPGGLKGVMSIVGPMRMDYGRNIALLHKAKQMIEEPLLLL